MADPLVTLAEIGAAAARIAAIVLALCACTALAQQPVMCTLTVIVEDQARARIPGARIAATDEATGARIEAITDASGHIVVHLAQGKYEIKVQASGFKTWKEKDVGINAEMQRTVTLLIGQIYSGPFVILDIPRIPLEYHVLELEIPLVPMQQFELAAKTLHHRRHWF